MIKTLIEKYKGPVWQIRQKVTYYGGPAIDLIARLWLARVFFNAGLTKIQSWENTVFLFEFEYQIPLLPPELTAFMAVCFELGMPVLLVFGFMTRLAALPLLSMAFVIQFILAASNPLYSNVEHFYWMILLVMIIVKGAGPLSIDYLMCKKICKSLN